METLADISEGNEITLILKREFNAPIEMVFDAWSRPEQMAEWMGPEGMSAPDTVADVKVGGRYTIPMVGDPAGVHTVTGEYLEISRPSKLAFTWAWIQDDGNPGNIMTVVVELEDANGRTAMTLSHSNFSDDDAKIKHNQGWSSSFDCLEEFLSS